MVNIQRPVCDIEISGTCPFLYSLLHAIFQIFPPYILSIFCTEIREFYDYHPG